MNRHIQQELLNSPIGQFGGQDDDGTGNVTSADHPDNDGSRPILRLDSEPNIQQVAMIRPAMRPPSIPCITSQLPPPTRNATFIEQVLRILDDATLCNFEHIVSWRPDGASFKVHRIRNFETMILPRYLEQTKVRSFQRQLIKHGFHRVQGGPNRGSYLHPKFIREDRNSCLSIGKIKRQKSNDDNDIVDTPAVKLDDMSDHFQQAVQESRPTWTASRSQDKTKQEHNVFLHADELKSPISASTASKMQADLVARAAVKPSGISSTQTSLSTQRDEDNLKPSVQQKPPPSTLPAVGSPILPSSLSTAKWTDDSLNPIPPERQHQKIFSSQFPALTPHGESSANLDTLDMDLALASPENINSSPDVSKPTYCGLSHGASMDQRNQASYSLESPNQKVFSSRFLPRTLPGQINTDLDNLDMDFDLPFPANSDSSTGGSKPSFFDLASVASSDQPSRTIRSTRQRIEFSSLLENRHDDETDIWSL